jgi:MFS family permease
LTISGWKLQSVIAGAGILLSSYDMGLMAMALVGIKHVWRLAGWELSTVASITSVGMILGSLAGGVLADRYGRRGVLVWDYVCFLGAALVSAVSPDIWWLLFARLVVGFGVGADFSISFAFLAEVCPVAQRGRTMAWVMWLANFGTVVAYGVGSWFLASGGNNGWRWTLATGVILAIPLIVMRSRVTESPLWQREHQPQHLGDVVRYFALPKVRRTLGVAQGSYFLYQITDQGLGMFLPLILISLFGASIGTAAWSSVLVKAVTIPAALCTVWLIDRWGRRPLQIFGFAGRALALLTLGVLFIWDHHVPIPLLAALMVAAYFFGPAGPDKTIVITPAEQFQTPWRGTGEGLSEMAGRIGGVVGIAGYGFVSALWGTGAGLMFFGMACALGTLLSLRMQETRPHWAGPDAVATPTLQ